MPMDAELRAIYNYLPLSSRIATSGQPTAQQIQAIAEAGWPMPRSHG